MAKVSTQSFAGGLAGGLMALVALFLVGSFIYNQAQPKVSPHTEGEVWHKSMSMGKADAKNKLVEYSDYFCSFCATFHKAAGEEFDKKYIDSGLVRYETRIITVLSGKSVNTMTGANAAHCAADQGKYWEYSHAIITKLGDDYFSKQIGIGPGYPPIEKLPLSYFSDLAGQVGIEVGEFNKCVSTEKHSKTISQDTAKAERLGVSGLPYIVVNNRVSSGFQGGFPELELMLKAGGVKEN